MTDALIIDLFAGGGGASAGIEAALGRPVDIGINHDPIALAVHKANHPGTRHLEADIWEVKPQEATEGRPVAILWASPDCTHFSIAKGGTPRQKKIRSLAWAVVRWAKAVAPAVIFLENVTEFKTWGPLTKAGRPDKRFMGRTFAKWQHALERLGYVVDYRTLDASLYGAPTRRRRLFLIARRDGLPITWPTCTHGPGKAPVHTAAECIDWSLPCPSIFERVKPLADKTQWRIAQGIKRFVIDTPKPFIIQVNHGKMQARGEAIDEPLTTVTAQRRGSHALVTPYIAGVGGRASQSAPTGMGDPVGTITAKNDRVIVTPVLAPMNADNPPMSVERPLGTVTSQHNRFQLVSPTLIQTSWGEDMKRNGGLGQPARVPGLHKPLGTVVAGGIKHALVAAFLARQFGFTPANERKPGVNWGGVVGQPVDEPASTVTARDHHALTAATLIKLRGECNGSAIDAPMPTLTAAGNHVAQVRAFLTYYASSDGPNGQSLDDPMRTILTKDRLGLVTVEGVEYAIADIGMRMLEPHELLRAQFGRFATSYDLTPARTKTAKVRLIGNSVCPEVAEAIVRANTGRQVAQVAA